MIDNLCQRWGCTPSQLMKEDANVIFHILSIRDAAGDNEEADG